MKHLHLAFALTAALLLGACKSPSVKSPQPSAGGQEAGLITVLKSDAPQKEKADACRKLARLGTKAAVPALVALLGDEQLSHMARYGLETIPGPAVDNALRDALPSLKDRQLAGVITSLGARRDPKAARPIARFLPDANPDISKAAARALGNIGTKDSAQALEAALTNATIADKLAICEGLFRCAEAFTKQGQRRDAIRIYDRLRELPDAAHQVRAGALRGAILARGPDGLTVLAEAIRGDDWVLAGAAARTAMEMRGVAVTTTLIGELDRLPGDRRVLVLQILGRRGDATALPAVFAAAKSGDKNARLTAIRAVAEIGDASAAPSLVDLACDADREISETARQSLAALSGTRTDDTVFAMLESADGGRKLAGIDLVARRRMSGAVPVLLKLAADADPGLRAAALKQLGAFGGEPELPALLARLERTTEPRELTALEEALGTLCNRIGNADACAEKLIARLDGAKPAQQASLLRVLGSVGGAKALATVRANLDRAKPEIRAAALQTLADWPTSDAAPELLALARAPGNPDNKLLCLRSYLRWARDTDVPPKQRLAMCKDAASLVQRDEERKLLLAALGGINSPEAVAQIAPFVDANATREEACVAAVTIAEKITSGRNAAALPARLVPILEKIAAATTNPDLAKRASALLKK